MSKYIVSVIDTTGIQPYIFGSNRLRENIGASYLVAQATNYWVKQVLRQRFGDNVYIPDGNPQKKRILYLKAFEAETATIPDGKELTACAGIAIVKTHYPFARAYQLSEALCRNAKNFVCYEKKRRSDFSALDWHIAASGLLGSISDIRKREYQVPEGNLTMRPVYLHSESDWRNWTDFSKVVREFNTHPNWVGRRNKVVALREQLRQGSEKTKQFLQVYGLHKDYLPRFSAAQTDDLHQTGWTDDPRTNERICAYFDAIEAMEFHVPLEEKNHENLPSKN